MATTASKSDQNKKAFTFELVSPTCVEVNSLEQEVIIPGHDGDFMVLPGHTRLITNLRNGVLKVIRGDQEAHVIYVTGGFADIGPDHCTVLASQAIPVHKMNETELQERLELLNDDLTEKPEKESADIKTEIAETERKLEILESLKN